jgi:hypothetical protein
VRIRVVTALVVFALAAAACSSGPSFPNARPPTSTTTTEAPEVGVQIVRINNGSFQPSNLAISLDDFSVLRFIQEDADRTYTLVSSDGLFENVELNQGDVFDVDLTGQEEKIYRFSALFGFNRLPLSVDTRPDL